MSSIIWVHERIADWSGNRNDKGDYEFTRAFDVLTETLNVGPYAVLNASDPNSGLAIPGDFQDYHAGDDAVTFAWVKSKTAKRDTVQPRLWTVEVRWSTDRETQQRQTEENPLNRPAKRNWGSEHYSKVVDHDLRGKPMQNSAGEFFDPLPEIDDSRPILTVTRNEANPWNFSRAIQYQDAINSDEFYGFDPRQCKINIRANEVYENLYHYWEVTYEIHFRREGWRLKLINRGKNELVGGELKAILDPRTKQPVTEPKLLDASGAVTTSVYTKTFKVYKELAFGPLGL